MFLAWKAERPNTEGPGLRAQAAVVSTLPLQHPSQTGTRVGVLAVSHLWAFSQCFRNSRLGPDSLNVCGPG